MEWEGGGYQGRCVSTVKPKQLHGGSDALPPSGGGSGIGPDESRPGNGAAGETSSEHGEWSVCVWCVGK